MIDIKTTLQSRLLLVFLVITLFSTFITGYISYQSQKSALTIQLENSLTVLSNTLAIEVEDFIGERINDIELLAQNPILKNPSSSLEDSRREFKHFLDIHDIYFGNIFVNSDGIVTVDMDDMVMGRDLSSRTWFREAMKGNTYFSDIYLSPVVNNPLLVLGAPVKSKDGKIIGAIAPSFDLNALWDTIDRFTSQRKSLGLSGYAFLMNNEGELIAHPDRTKILKENFRHLNNLSKSKLEKTISNKELFYSEKDGTMNSFAKINTKDGFKNEWYVGISIQKDELYSPLYQLLMKYLILFGIIVLIMVIAIVKISKSILRPLNELVEATADFSLGKRVKPLSSNTFKEISTLNNTFNTMVEQIIEREKGYKKSTLILETTDNGVLSINKNSKHITTFNKKCEEIFKINKNEVIGKDIDSLTDKLHHFKEFLDNSMMIHFLETEESKNKNNIEFQVKIDNKIHSFLANISTLPGLDHQKGIEDILIIFSDITEKRLMENELIKAEKLKIAGQLAAGFAHEFRNPLTTIKGFIQLFKENKQDQEIENTNRYYQIVIDEIDRLDSIITNFLNISNPNGTGNYSKNNVNHLIDEMIILYQSEATKKKIKIATLLEKIPDIYTDPKQLKQVFVNIIKNAIEAMPSGGDLYISTRYVKEENIIEISFKDTGVGMDDETLNHIGKFFFSTKETGTGLGIATITRILEDMGAKLFIESKLNNGSTFTIKIPIAEEN